MYPHIIIAFNIERHTMICKLIIPEITEDKYEHFFLNEEIVDRVDDDDTGDDDDEEKEENIGYDSGKDFMDNLLTNDILSMGTKWFNLPDINEVHNEFKNKFKVKPKAIINLNRMVNFVGEVLKININKE